MDNFTLAVVVGDVVMCAAFIALIVMDKPRNWRSTIEPVKPSENDRPENGSLIIRAPGIPPGQVPGFPSSNI
jgi:hypothetical protein